MFPWTMKTRMRGVDATDGTGAEIAAETAAETAAVVAPPVPAVVAAEAALLAAAAAAALFVATKVAVVVATVAARAGAPAGAALAAAATVLADAAMLTATRSTMTIMSIRGGSRTMRVRKMMRKRSRLSRDVPRREETPWTATMIRWWIESQWDKLRRVLPRRPRT